MPNSSSSPTLRPKDTLYLFISSSNVTIPLEEALLEDSTLDTLHRLLAHATFLHSLKRLSKAIELADIMQIARAALENIRATIDQSRQIDFWSPSKYDSGKLANPGSDLLGG